MLVTLTTERVGMGSYYREGEQIDLPDREALALISCGSAIPHAATDRAEVMATNATRPTPETATKPRPENASRPRPRKR